MKIIDIGVSVLSDEELNLISGGCVGINTCGANACGIDACLINACGANACGANVVSVCLVDVFIINATPICSQDFSISKNLSSNQYLVSQEFSSIRESKLSFRTN
jgi:bacteriocin-like protein